MSASYLYPTSSPSPFTLFLKLRPNGLPQKSLHAEKKVCLCQHVSMLIEQNILVFVSDRSNCEKGEYRVSATMETAYNTLLARGLLSSAKPRMPTHQPSPRTTISMWEQFSEDL